MGAIYPTVGSSQTSPAEPHRRSDIDGLRGVAILSVLLYHARVPGVSGGYVGVDVFFVLSGFLMTNLLWRELAQRRSVPFGRFYARRARRLLPSAVLVLAVTTLASRWMLSPLRSRAVHGDALANALYAGNYRFAAASTNYLAANQPSPLLHYWSLAVEEQFYVLWPSLLLVASLVWRRGRPPSQRTLLGTFTVIGAASFIACVTLTRVAQPIAFFWLPTRVWEFVAGGLVVLLPAGRSWPGWAATVLSGTAGAALVLACTRFTDHTPFPGAAAALPVLASAGVIIAGSAARVPILTRLLTAAPLRAAGRISYAWYLWHWPFLVLAAARFGSSIGLAQRLLLVVVSGVVATATTLWFEEPIRRAPRLVARPRATLAMGAALTALAVTTGAVSSASLPSGHGTRTAAPLQPIARVTRRPTLTEPTLTEPATTTLATTTPAPISSSTTTITPDPRTALRQSVHDAIAAAVATPDVPANLQPSLGAAHHDEARPFTDGCFDGFAATTVHGCVYGDPTGKTEVVLFGDSHAAAWFPAIEPIAVARGWRLHVFSKATCPPLSAAVWAPNFGREYRECDQWRAAVLQQISVEHPATVVLAANRAYGDAYHLPTYGDPWLNGLGQTVAAIRAAGSTVVVLGPVPLPPDDVPDCLSRHPHAIDNCEAAPEQAVLDGIGAERQAVTAAGGTYIDVRPWFCTDQACAVIVGNVLVYRDQNHLTTEYANWLTPVMAAELDAVQSGS